MDPKEKRTARRMVQGNNDNNNFITGDADPNCDTFPGSPDDMSAFTMPPNWSERKSHPWLAECDKEKQKRKVDDIAEKAAGTVKEYIADI